MTTLTVDIENEKDLRILKEILTRFGLSYKVDEQATITEKDVKLYKKLKKTFTEIKDWETGKLMLQEAKEAIDEIKAEL